MTNIKFKHEYPPKPECPFTPEEEHEIRRNWLYGDYDGLDGVERTEFISDQLAKQEIISDWMQEMIDWEASSPSGQANRLIDSAEFIEREVEEGNMSVLAGIQILDEATDVLSDGMLECPDGTQCVTEVRANLVAVLSEYAA